MSGSLRGRTLLASGFHSPERGRIDAFTDALIVVDQGGEIGSMIRPDEAGYERALGDARDTGNLTSLPAGTYLLPGFVDLHIHAPQYPQLGQALDVPLEVWLRKYTFPLEARYGDLAFARRSYTLLVDDLLANGTTTAVYFATIHQDATRLLADICLERGQRALVGKVAMDNPDECPEIYRDASTDAALRGTSDLIAYIDGHSDNSGRLVRPAVTPRFIPSCTDATLEGLGAIARDCGCHVQTHCSESDWAHAYALERYGSTDAENLDRFGLLGRRSVLAHSNFLTPDDLDLIAARRSAVAHCAASNAYFANAVFPLQAALEKGVHVGLGTDISGGPSASLFDSMRAAIMASRMLETGVDPDLPSDTRGRPDSSIDFKDAFHLATAGGADALDLPVGRFEPGRQFDAIAIDTNAATGAIRLWDDLDRGEGILQKIVYGASRANVASVWVGGRLVSGDSARRG